MNNHAIAIECLEHKIGARSGAHEISTRSGQLFIENDVPKIEQAIEDLKSGIISDADHFDTAARFLFRIMNAKLKSPVQGDEKRVIHIEYTLKEIAKFRKS